MYKVKKLANDQSGVSAVQLVVYIAIIVVLIIIGYLLYSNHKNKPKAAVITVKKTTVTKSTQSPPPSKAPAFASYLNINEWGVKIGLSPPISNATYHIVTNNTYLKPAAFLSTSSLDASADCVAYYKQGETPNNPLPSFQFIERFNLTDTTSIAEGSPTITAAQAAQTEPNIYKKVGNYVYLYGHGNGEPCSEQTQIQTGAFQAAFDSINLITTSK
jgi:Flp pilus assembly protein TadG